MDFTLALVKNENQFELKTFIDGNSDGGQVINLDDIKTHKIDTLLYPKELESEELMATLGEEYKFFPVRPCEDFSVNSDNFKDLDHELAADILQKCIDSWTIQNNLELLENLFPTLEHLHQLWPNDRTSFMEELWFLLKKNLGSFDLKIIYNSMRRGAKEHEKNKLVQCRIEGKRFPETFEGSDFEKQVMSHYQSQFTESFEISEYSADRNELVATISLKGSPMILMAKVSELSRFQIALFTSFFTGLQK